jgi:hypothetical protein
MAGLSGNPIDRYDPDFYAMGRQILSRFVAKNELPGYVARLRPTPPEPIIVVSAQRPEEV